MSDQHEQILPASGVLNEEPKADSSDPRMRPSDPAGTRPKVDPGSLKPSLHTGQMELTAGDTNGYTDVDAAALAGTTDVVLPLTSTQSPIALTRGTHNPHTSRFQFLFGALGALAAAAAVLTIAILIHPSPPPTVPWSSWKPSADGGDPAQQIAEHVAPSYRRPGGQQLVQVTGGPQAVGGQPVVLALRSSGSEPSPLPNNGVFYELCGTGPNCSIPGKASSERALLLDREALELALYTFRYIGEASQVVVTIPPKPPGTTSKAKGSASKSTSSTAPNHVLLFRPDELSVELSKPLEATLPASVPSVHTVSSSPGAPLVNRLSVSALYDSTITQQESTLVMLLQAPSLDG